MKFFKDSVFIVIGTFLLAISVSSFILPYDILSGGVGGIAVLIKCFVNVDENVLVVIINSAFFVLGLLFLGKGFAINTIVSTIAYPICQYITNNYIPSIKVEPLIAAIYAGVLGGVGIAICIRHDGSTGGADVPPLIFEKFFGFDVSKGVMVFDSLTVLFGLWLYGIENILMGLICVYITSISIEKVMNIYDGKKQSKRIEIISDQYEKIISDIHIVIDKGTTLMPSIGGYTGNDRMVVLCVVPQNRYKEVIEIVNKYDPKAFVIVSDTYDVHGEGFTFEARL